MKKKTASTVDYILAELQNIQKRTQKKQEVMQFDKSWRGEIASELEFEVLNSYF